MFLNIAGLMHKRSGAKKAAVAAIVIATLSTLRVLSELGQVVWFRVFFCGDFIYFF